MDATASQGAFSSASTGAFKVCVKLGTQRGALEGSHEGRQNLAGAWNAWPRPPPPPGVCKDECTPGL